MTFTLEKTSIQIFAKEHNPTILSKEWLSKKEIIQEKRNRITRKNRATTYERYCTKSKAAMKENNWSTVTKESTHAREARICNKFIRHFPKEMEMYRLRVGKTIYCFTSEQRVKEKLKQLV